MLMGCAGDEPEISYSFREALCHSLVSRRFMEGFLFVCFCLFVFVFEIGFHSVAHTRLAWNSQRSPASASQVLGLKM